MKIETKSKIFDKKLIGLIVLLLVALFYFLFLSYKEYSSIDVNGYILTDAKIVDNLYNSVLSQKDSTLNKVSVNNNDIIYTQNNNYYVGSKEKQKINNSLPIFSKDNSKIVNLAENNYLIDADYNFYEGYPNLILSSGELYNQNDYTRADNNTYIFLSLDNNLFLNTKKITLNDNDINPNSIIYLTENEIRYYSLINDEFKYNVIYGVSYTDILLFNDSNIKYEDLLNNLKLLSNKEYHSNNEDIGSNINDENSRDKYSSGNGVDTISNDDNEAMKPVVECEDFIPGVYSIHSSLKIVDKRASIKKSISFEIRKDGKVYLRKQFEEEGNIEISGLIPNTTYEIVGTYSYINSNDQEILNTFFKQKIKTNDIDTLKPFDLSYEYGDIYAKKIELNKLQIVSDLTNETIKGIKKASIEIGNNTYGIELGIASSIALGNSVTYTSIEKLKSNSEYDFTIHFYDSQNNELPVNNNKGHTYTSKQDPTVNIEISTNNVTNVLLTFNQINVDKVLINNYRYVIYADNKIVEEAEIGSTKSISLNNLDSNEVYEIKVYGDYDLGNGQGNKKNMVLGEGSFTTSPLDSLGFVRLNYETVEIKQNSASFSLIINNRNIDERLIKLLSKFVIKVYDEDDKEVGSYDIDGVNINKMKLIEPCTVEFENLLSNSDYKVKITSVLTQGTKEYEYSALSELNSFKTIKQDAQVVVINKFTNESLIDFDVKVVDHDSAIESTIVDMQMYDENSNIVEFTEIPINGDYIRLTYNKLNSNVDYSFVYRVDEYNVGFDNTTYEEKKVLLSEVINTSSGLSGFITLDHLLKGITGKNLYDPDNSNNWSKVGTSAKVDNSDGSITLIAKNTPSTYAYYMPEYRSKNVTISFDIKYTNSSSNDADVYITNNERGAKTYLISNVNYDTWTHVSYTLNLSRNYLGFYIDEVTGQLLSTSIDIKNLMIESGSVASSYEPYTDNGKYMANMLIDINDLKHEITNNDYYVTINDDTGEIDSYHYLMNGEYNLDDIKSIYALDPNKNYSIYLKVRIRDRYYTLSQIAFNTEKEIRSIKTLYDWKWLNVNGKYLLANDLDLTDSSGSSMSNGGAYFSGEIDFQGYRVNYVVDNYKSVSNVHELSHTGVFRNLNLHIYYRNTTAKVNNYSGFIASIVGKVENLMITIEEATQVPNTFLSVFTATNNGTINNFVINTKVAPCVAHYVGLLARYNSGVISNGYVYGEGIDATLNNPDTSEKRTGLIAGYTDGDSLIKNVFTISNINIPTNYSAIDYQVGNIIGQATDGTLINAYSVGNGENRIKNQDVSFGTNTQTYTKNVYYAGESLYKNNQTVQVSKLALYNKEFQNNILNTENSFVVDYYVEHGYYPQLNWDENMPKQELIPLPEIEDEDLVDVINFDYVTEDSENVKYIAKIHNPSQEKVSKIEIKDITVDIISQYDENGTSYVTIELSDPTYYVSKYFLKRIVTIGAFNIPYERTYADNERPILVDMYRNINSVDDFKAINDSNEENYRLMKDLDFTNVPLPQIKDFKGKLEGNNHTLKNITLDSGGSLFNKLSGSIRNLYIENYNKLDTSTFGGVIGSAYFDAEIVNVHVKNATITGSSYIGGLVGYATSTQITNCSVSYFKNGSLLDVTNVYVGGLVGQGIQVNINNSYVNQLSLDLTEAEIITYAGGFIGYHNSGTINNCYVIGTINTASINTGGFSGGIESIINNIYSNVTITSTADWLAGISVKPGNTPPKNSIAFGSLFSTISAEYIGKSFSSGRKSGSNYVWEKLLINGLESSENSGSIVITTEELRNKYSYANILGSNFDYTGCENDILPKLYYQSSTELLPNQEDNYLTVNDLQVSKIMTEKRINNAWIAIYIDNPNKLTITGIEIDYLNVDEIRKNVTTESGQTEIDIIASPKYALDGYCITKINYLDSSGNSMSMDTKVKIELQFFKEIADVNDYKKLEFVLPENIRLTGDIDFDNEVNIPVGKDFNRIDGQGYSIKNLTYTFKKSGTGFINKLVSSMNNISFTNINISSTDKTAKLGIIKYSFARINDINLTNITINAKCSYVGFISQSRSGTARNINISNVNLSGISFVGSLYGYSAADGDVYNVNLNTAVINGTSYVGGIIGERAYESNSDKMGNCIELHADNVSVIGKENYVGGIGGASAASSSTVTNSYISGKTEIGGIVGSVESSVLYDSRVTNSVIHGTGTNIAGVAGVTQKAYRLSADNISVYGDSTNSTRVAGVVGTSSGFITLGITNSTVTNLGDVTGGVIAYCQNESEKAYASNVTINGRNYVGGIVGKMKNQKIYNVYANVTINASEKGAGGIIGYLNNADADDQLNALKISGAIVENSIITAPTYSGGFIGFADVILPTTFFNNVIIHATVNSTGEDSSNGITVGNGDTYGLNITPLRIYNHSQVNGVNAVELDTSFPLSVFVTRSALLLTTSYTFFNGTGKWDITPISSECFPILSDVDYQIAVPIPEDNDVVSNGSLLLYQASALSVFPKINVYPIDANKINIEFSEITPYTTFKYQINDFESEDIPLKQYTYSFEYNFTNDFKIIINNGIDSKEITISKDSLIRHVLTIKDGYYYLKNNKLITNKNTLPGEYIHLYNNNILSKDLKMYEVTTHELIDNNVSDLELLSEIIPLYKFNYDNYEIQTYYNYSIVNTKIVSGQVIVKDGLMSIISSDLNTIKDTIIIDNYGKNEYQTVLGTNHKLYNLKASLIYDSDFENKNIKYITNNINNDTSILLVEYENGSIYGFDYRTGKSFINDKVKVYVNIVDYIVNNITAEEEVINEKEVQKSYEETNTLITKLNKKNVNEVLNNTEEMHTEIYTTSYDPIKGEYVVFDMNMIVDNTVDTTKSISDIINNKPELINFYNPSSSAQMGDNVNRMIIFILILGAIMASIILYKKYIVNIDEES